MPIILGLGTGRSGTQSLAYIVNQQPEAVCFHEVNPACMAWQGAFCSVYNLVREFERVLAGGPRCVTVDRSAPDRDHALERLQGLERVSLIGDIAMYYLPYVERVLELEHDVRFPCLRRDREAVIESYIGKVRLRRTRRERIFEPLAGWLMAKPVRTSRNHWMLHDGRHYQPDPVWDKCYPKFDATGLRQALGLYWDTYHEEVDRLATRYPRAVAMFDLDELNSREGQRRVLGFCGIEQPTYSEDVHRNRGEETRSR